MSRNHKRVLNPPTYDAEEERESIARAQGRNKMVTMTVNEELGTQKFTFGKLNNLPNGAREVTLYALPITKAGEFRKNGKIHLGWLSEEYGRDGFIKGNYTQGLLCKKGIDDAELGMTLNRSQDFEELIPMYYPFSSWAQFGDNQPSYKPIKEREIINRGYNYNIESDAERFYNALKSSGALCEKCVNEAQTYNNNWFISPKGRFRLAESFDAEEIKNTIFDKYIDEWDWNELSENPALTPAFIEDNIGKLNWQGLSDNSALSLELIEKYETDLDWGGVCLNHNLTIAFIEAHIEKINWFFLSSNPALTPAFIEDNIDKLDWHYLIKNPALSLAIIEKYIGRRNIYWSDLSLNPGLTPSFIEDNIDKLDWRALSQNPALTVALIEKYESKLDWKRLSKNPNLTPAFIEQNIDKLDWYWLSQNPALTSSLIDSYIHDPIQPLDWKSLSGNPNITLYAIESAIASGQPLEMDVLSSNPAIFKPFLNPYELMLRRRMDMKFDAEETDLKCSQCDSQSIQLFKDSELGEWEICFDCGKAVEVATDWVVDIDWDKPPATKPDVFGDSIQWEAESEIDMKWFESPKWAMGEFEVPALIGADREERRLRKCRYLKNPPTGYDLLICNGFSVWEAAGLTNVMNSKHYSIYIITPSEQGLKTGILKHTNRDIKQLKDAKKQGLELLNQVIQTESIMQGQMKRDNPYEIMLKRRLGIKIKDKSPKIKFTVQPMGNEVIIYAESQEFKLIEFLRGDIVTNEVQQNEEGFPQNYYFRSNDIMSQIIEADYPNEFLNYVADYFLIATRYGEPYYADATAQTVYTTPVLRKILDTFSDYYTGNKEEKQQAKENIPEYITTILDTRKGDSVGNIIDTNGQCFKVNNLPCVVLDTWYRNKGNYNNPSHLKIIKGNYDLIEIKFSVSRKGNHATQFQYHLCNSAYASNMWVSQKIIAGINLIIKTIVYNNRNSIRKDISMHEIRQNLIGALMQYFAENDEIISTEMNKHIKSTVKGYNRWKLELAGRSIEPFIFVVESGRGADYNRTQDGARYLIVKNNKFEYVPLPSND